MDYIISQIQQFLLSIFAYEEIVIILIAILPIVEARLAVPMAVGYGMSWWQAWLYSFLGSTIIAPILLLVLIPIIRWLAKTKLFHKIGEALYSKFENKSKQIDEKASDWKKFWGLFIFVAIPLPLTGVWTGCAVGSILKMKYPHALGAVALGNFVASGIITLLTVLFPAHVDLIITIIGIIALVVVIALIIKIITYKPKKEKQETNDENSAN